METLGVPCFLGGMARGLLGRNHPLHIRQNRSAALKKADVVLLAGGPRPPLHPSLSLTPEPPYPVILLLLVWCSLALPLPLLRVLNNPEFEIQVNSCQVAVVTQLYTMEDTQIVDPCGTFCTAFTFVCVIQRLYFIQHIHVRHIYFHTKCFESCQTHNLVSVIAV